MAFETAWRVVGWPFLMDGGGRYVGGGCDRAQGPAGADQGVDVCACRGCIGQSLLAARAVEAPALLVAEAVGDAVIVGAALVLAAVAGVHAWWGDGHQQVTNPWTLAQWESREACASVRVVTPAGVSQGQS